MSESVLIWDLNKAAAELCKREFSFFVREFWSTIIAEELVWEPHMDVLCNEVQMVFERVFLQDDPEDAEPNPAKRRKIRLKKLNDLVINIPPGTTKSTIVTIMAPAWAWTRDASLRIITGSYSDSLATEHAVKSRDIIQCDKYKLYFPHVEIKDHKGLKTNYETTQNGQRYATSVGGTITGIHAHIIIIDDPLNPKQATSVVECKTANDWQDKTMSMRKVDKEVTVTILMMQRLAVNDNSGHLLAKKKLTVRHICLPAELSDNVSPVEYRSIYVDGLLSPKRLSKAVLTDNKIDLGSDGYAGQMAQRPAPEGGEIWQKWFVEVPDELFPEAAKADSLGSDWDLAYTSEETNAASAFVKSGIISNKIYLFDFDWKWLEFPNLIKWMKEVGGPHYIEAKASGKSAKQTLLKQGIIAIEVKVQGGKDKVARARSVTPVAESGICYIRKSMADRLYNDDKQGILHFPKGQFKDLADALAQALQRHSGKGRLHVSDPDNGEDGAAAGTENPLDWVD